MSKTVKTIFLLSFLSVMLALLFVVYASHSQHDSPNVSTNSFKAYNPMEIFRSRRARHDSNTLANDKLNKTKQKDSSFKNIDSKIRDFLTGSGTEAKVDNKQTTQSDNQTPEKKPGADVLWQLDALDKDYSTQETIKDSANSPAYLDNDNYIQTDFDYSQPKKKDKNNNKKYAKEKLYINILAAILAYYQFPNDSQESMSRFASFFDKRSEEGRKQVLKEADDYIKISTVLRNTTDVPDKMRGINMRVANAYEKAGLKLKKLAQDMPDDERLRLTRDYNKAADDVARALISVSDMIDILNLSFDDNEPGKIFVFPGNPQLDY